LHIKPSHFSALALSAALLFSTCSTATAYASTNHHRHHATSVNDDPGDTTGGGDPIPTPGMMCGGTLADILNLALSVAGLA
jgi:hypothetical protein